jgi:hypothetical protein
MYDKGRGIGSQASILHNEVKQKAHFASWKNEAVKKLEQIPSMQKNLSELP